MNQSHQPQTLFYDGAFRCVRACLQRRRHQIIIDNNIGTHNVYALSINTHCLGKLQFHVKSQLLKPILGLGY